MMNLNNEKILITGGSGYIASWIAFKLAERGCHVSLTSRRLDDPRCLLLESKVQPLEGTVQFFQADLLDKDSLRKPIMDSTLIFHTASPFKSKINSAYKDLILPALEGTKNVLNLAKENPNLKRIVLTSSVAAVLGDNQDLKNYPNQIADESCWNETSSEIHNPYSYSKTLAEKAAWEIFKSQNQWSMVTINPSFVIGPSITHHPDAESFQVMKQYLSGAFLLGVPEIYIGAVDVRDVADAHISAMENLSAEGRYITSAKDTGFKEIGIHLKKKFPKKVKFSPRKVPKIFIALSGRFISKLLTYKFIMNNVGYVWRTKNDKSIKSLGIKYRDILQSSEEMIEQIIQKN